jgi:hypothetical protein
MGDTPEIPCGPTLIISLGTSLAAFHNLSAPTLLVAVMISPEMLSTHDKDEMPVAYFSNFLIIVSDSILKRHIIPSV